MPRRFYGQYCGFARALELVGERWALLIIRDLLVGSKRFGELQRGLPGIPTNILSARLSELEDEGLVTRVALPRPARGVAYELTEFGRGLEDAVIAIGRWGAQRLGDPRPGEVVTDDSIASALLTTFRAEREPGPDVTFLLKLGDVVLHARVVGGVLTVGRGAIAEADLTIETGMAMRALIAREITPKEALEKKIVRIHGDPALLDRFVTLFQI